MLRRSTVDNADRLVLAELAVRLGELKVQLEDFVVDNTTGDPDDIDGLILLDGGCKAVHAGLMLVNAGLRSLQQKG